MFVDCIALLKGHIRSVGWEVGGHLFNWVLSQFVLHLFELSNFVSRLQMLSQISFRTNFRCLASFAPSQFRWIQSRQTTMSGDFEGVAFERPLRSHDCDSYHFRFDFFSFLIVFHSLNFPLCGVELSNNSFFIHSGYFYSASSSPLLGLLRGALDTAHILCRNFTPKRHKQLWVKDLPKVSTWWLERESDPWPFGLRASTIPKRKHAPPNYIGICMGHGLLNEEASVIIYNY